MIRRPEGESFAQIHDADSDKYRDQNQVALEKRREVFTENGGDLSAVSEMDLMAELFQIQDFYRKAVNTSSSVVLDITSFPKRFFFLLLQTLMKSDQVKNLLVTYSSPEAYAEGALYEDFDAWKTMPGFGGEKTGRESLIVSIGFLVESLTGYLKNNPDHGKVKMLIPFPAPLDSLKRVWESVSKLDQERGNSNPFEKFRVEALDLSAAFDRIKSLASNSENPTAFAPFGPKPTSAAMCLYAIQKGSAIYYPQPTVYHPEYSIGIRGNDPANAISAYWIKHEGENLYEI